MAVPCKLVTDQKQQCVQTYAIKFAEEASSAAARTWARGQPFGEEVAVAMDDRFPPAARFEQDGQNQRGATTENLHTCYRQNQQQKGCIP